MDRYGYSLMCEAKAPRALVDEARMAEEAGFSFVTISDHFHPWLESQQHSGYCWSILGAIAQATERIELVTMVTCPTFRYHPAIVAQKAATMAVLSDGRFTLGLGAGERLNEHVTGEPWPSVDDRHERLAEAIEIIQLLHGGGYVTRRGTHFDVDSARLFDLPEQPVDIFAGAAGPRAAELAARCGVGVCNVEPLPEIIEAFTAAGGDAERTWGQTTLAWAATPDEGLKAAFEGGKFMVEGWKVMAELPNVVNFEASTRFLRPEDMAPMVATGPDPQAHLGQLARFRDAGYHQISVQYPGEDLEGFMQFWSTELAPQLVGADARRGEH